MSCMRYMFSDIEGDMVFLTILYYFLLDAFHMYGQVYSLKLLPTRY